MTAQVVQNQARRWSEMVAGRLRLSPDCSAEKFCVLQPPDIFRNAEVLADVRREYPCRDTHTGQGCASALFVDCHHR
eukprot:COSAG02_NODE_1961_length_10255_cov_5.103771_3_plen_77_part_00